MAGNWKKAGPESNLVPSNKGSVSWSPTLAIELASLSALRRSIRKKTPSSPGDGSRGPVESATLVETIVPIRLSAINSFNSLVETQELSGILVDPQNGEFLKYFDEEKMSDIRKAFEAEILNWKGVVSKPMMGCLCYFYNRKFLGFLVTDGIVVMKLSEKDQSDLKKKFGGKPFEMAGQTGRLWVTPLKRLNDVRSVMPFVRKRYEEVSSTRVKT
jgi:hypothetical protein